MEDKTFELIEKLYIEFTDFRKETGERFDGADQRFDSIDKRLAFIEQEHGKKLQTLFDGYKQHSDQLGRIEQLVSGHDDIIIREIK